MGLGQSQGVAENEAQGAAWGCYRRRQGSAVVRSQGRLILSACALPCHLSPRGGFEGDDEHGL